MCSMNGIIDRLIPWARIGQHVMNTVSNVFMYIHEREHVCLYLKSSRNSS